MCRKRARFGSSKLADDTQARVRKSSARWPGCSGCRLGASGSASLSAAWSTDFEGLAKTGIAEKKGNELVALTGGGNSGSEETFVKLGIFLDRASEGRMNYKKGAASSVFGVTTRDLFQLPRSVRLEISKRKSSEMAPTDVFSHRPCRS